MKGTLYGVGVGPGDKKLLTLEAVEILSKADKIAVPDTGGEKIALNIIMDYVAGKEILYCPMPMTRDKELLDKSHCASADRICGCLDKGENIAFITLGDPTIYSTYMYVHRLVLERGYDTKIISGIPSFCAAAAALNISLCDGGDILHIIPASYENIDEMISLKGNKVLMKSGKSMENVKQTLKKFSQYENAKMVECCSMDNERIYNSLDDIDEKSSYFSIIIVKE